MDAFEVGFAFFEEKIEALSSILAFLAGRCDFVAEGAFLVVVEEGIVGEASVPV